VAAAGSDASPGWARTTSSRVSISGDVNAANGTPRDEYRPGSNVALVVPDVHIQLAAHHDERLGRPELRAWIDNGEMVHHHRFDRQGIRVRRRGGRSRCRKSFTDMRAR
jgi:hypothetical protein